MTETLRPSKNDAEILTVRVLQMVAKPCVNDVHVFLHLKIGKSPISSEQLCLLTDSFVDNLSNKSLC